MDRNSYTVGLICALSHELTACRAMLDRIHEPLRELDHQDNNVYSLGEIGDHRIAIACLPAGRYGVDSAATVATNMLRTFTSIKIGLMVGIGGGVPSSSHDIRLGDVVVSKPTDEHGGVINYDMVKLLPGDFKRKGHLNKPPLELLSALNILIATHDMEDSRVLQYTSEALKRYPKLQDQYSSPGSEKDLLYKTECEHQSNTGLCSRCPKPEQIRRKDRGANEGPHIHYGLIGSGSKVVASMKDRDKLKEISDNILCFEMEAAGLMDTFPCLVIRGVSDYADSFKRDDWQPYAALTAAAYAKELLRVIPASQVANMRDAKSIEVVEKVNYDLGLQLMDAPRIDQAKFVGRRNELNFLEDCLLPSPDNPGQRCVTVQGLGGIGKSQLAVRFASQFRSQFSSVFWLRAHDESSLKQSFISMSKCIQRMDESTSDSLNKLEEDRLLPQALSWLSKQDNSNWLLILDNYDNPSFSNQPTGTAYDIRNYFPDRSHGAILITTQSSRVEIGKRQTLRKFESTEDGLEILIKRSEREDIRRDPDAERLVLRLDGLPLALTTAGDYLRQTPISCERYLHDYEHFWADLAQSADDLPDYVDRTLYNTWNMSLERVTSTLPEVSKLMQFFAYFDNKEIWFELLHGGYDSPFEWHQSIFQSEIKFRSIMRKLQDYSLVEANHDSKTYRLHSCVHDWTQGHLNRSTDESLLILAFHCVSRLVKYDDDELYWETGSLLEPHAMRLAKFVNGWKGVADEEISSKIATIAVMLDRRDKQPAAGALYRPALSGMEKALGPDHKLTLHVANDLGILLMHERHFEEAEVMFTRALAGYENVLGPNHELLLRTLNNLGLLFYCQGKFSEAKVMYQRALAGKEEASGSDDTLTLDILHNLASLYADQGKATEAEVTFERALFGYEKALGSNHVSTLDTLYSLGKLFRDQDKLDEAETMFQRALLGYEKDHKPLYISTLQELNRLGILFRYEGKDSKAESTFEQVVAGYEKALEGGDLSTLDAICNLAYVLRHQGKLDKAEAALQRAFLGYQNALGSGHSSTIQAVEMLFDLYTDQIRTEPYHSSAYSIRSENEPWAHVRNIIYKYLTTLLTLDHFAPTYLPIFGRLGRCYLWIGDLENAEITFEQQIINDTDGSSTIYQVSCDGCGSGMKPATGRFICMSCNDVDLCYECHGAYKSKDMHLPDCQDHNFFNSSRDSKKHWDYDTRVEWLQNTRKKYDEGFSVEPMAVEPSTSQDKQPSGSWGGILGSIRYIY